MNPKDENPIAEKLKSFKTFAWFLVLCGFFISVDALLFDFRMKELVGIKLGDNLKVTTPLAIFAYSGYAELFSSLFKYCGLAYIVYRYNKSMLTLLFWSSWIVSYLSIVISSIFGSVYKLSLFLVNGAPLAEIYQSYTFSGIFPITCTLLGYICWRPVRILSATLILEAIIAAVYVTVMAFLGSSTIDNVALVWGIIGFALGAAICHRMPRKEQ